MKIIDATLEAMAVREDQYPADEWPEIAFAGRSNVGKSTFINTLARRKKLAYISQTPGKTRTVNFYRLTAEWPEEGEMPVRRFTFRLVDLPGYGYARAAKGDQEGWAKIINRYLASRHTLNDVFLLCDLRHPPTAQDIEMYRWMMAAGFSGTVLATKADKVPRTKRAAHAKQIAQTLGTKVENVLVYAGQAATKIEGLDPIERKILSLLQPAGAFSDDAI